MAVNLNAVSLWNTGSITPTAPLIEGGVAATLAANQGGFGPYYNFGSSLTGRYGMRVTYPSALDFSGYEWATLTAYVTIYGPGDNLDTVANGGIRIYFVDSAGNYAGYNLYGQVPDYDASRSREGFLVSYGTVNNVFAISTARTPDIVSGSLNWSSIKHVEVTTKTVSASRKDFGLSRICKRSAPSITGTEKIASIGDAVRNATSSLLDPLLVQVTPYYFQAAAQSNVTLRIGLTVGNGSTYTNLTDSDFSVGFENPYEFSPAYRSVGPWVQLGDARVRALKINQSATDVLSLTDGSIASAGWWQWELSGSGAATCTRVQFWRFNGFRSAHGNYIDCEWNGAPAPVEVTAATVITGGRIRGATATGLKITGPAKAYTDISTILNNPSAVYDIELGSGGAGTYELLGITVPSGYTLKLRNDSASNAVVVKIPLGIAYTASTAGGAISVQTPVVSVTIEAPALIAGSRIQLYDVTSGVEMLNTVLTSAGLTYTALYTGNKIIRLRADHATKLPLETLGALTASGLTFLDIQAEDDVYITNGVDGETCTEFSADGLNIQIDIDDPDGVTYVQRIYAWMQWYMTTEAGIASPFFASMVASDEANYIIDQDKANVQLDNVSVMTLRVIGAALTRKDGSDLIAPSSGKIHIYSGRVFIAETGISGLTPSESEKLTAASQLTPSALWNFTQ